MKTVAQSSGDRLWMPEELPVDWERTGGIVRNTAKVVFGVSSGERNVDRATQGEVQESI